MPILERDISVRRAYLTYVDHTGRVETQVIHNYLVSRIDLEGIKELMLTGLQGGLLSNCVTEWPAHMRALERFVNEDIDDLPRVSAELPEDFERPASEFEDEVA